MGVSDEVESWVGLAATATEAERQEEELSEASAIKGHTNLRPNYFSEYIGQEAVKENLKIACNAAARRKEPLDHLLLHGPPGLGKTSLAKIIAREMGVGFKSTSGPVIEKPGDLAAILTALEANDVLFIDEIHRLPRVVEEVLYPALEDQQIDILIGAGQAAKSVKIELKPFTLVGATTRTGLLTSPLRDRFGVVVRLGFYTPEQLSQIVVRSAKLLGTKIELDAADEIGRRARGTPRIANRLLRRLRDFAEERADGEICLDVVRRGLKMLQVDERGLDEMDRHILEIVIDRYAGGPVGIEAVAAALGEEAETIEEVYEPFLVQVGLIARTRRGRAATDLAYKHLGRPVIEQRQSIFEE